MKTVLEAFTSLNKSVDMKSSEKSPTLKFSSKRNNSSYRKNNINRYRKSTSLFSSVKKQKTLGEYFSGRANKRQHAIKNPNQLPKSARKCLFERSHYRNTAGLDETSSSSLPYSSNSQRFIDVDIAGHCSRLDIDGRLEIVELADNQLFNRSENEESEKENSPQLKRTRSSTSTSQNDEGKATLKLNYAVIKEIDYYNESMRDDFSRPEGYYRYLEGDCDERQEKVEYDLDDEDICWMNIVKNTKSHLAERLAQDSLEMAIDRLEKVSAHLQLNSIKDGSAEHKNKAEEICDDDIYCSICLDDECQNSNVILLCDSCNLAVHQDCYGIPYVPEGQWLCSWCLHKKDNPKEESVTIKKGVTAEKGSSASLKKSSKHNLISHDGDGECCLCPVKGGALKKTNDGRWAHVLCALWIPEVGFENIEYLEPITKLEEVPPARHKLVCSVCKKKDAGACIQCMKRNCYVAFHIMCAQKVGTYMKIEQGSSDPEDSPSSIKKSFYCDLHKPEGAKPFTPMYDDDDEDDENANDVGDVENVDSEEFQQKQKDKSKRSTGSRKKVSKKKVKDTKSKSSKSQTAKSVGTSLRPTSISELPDIPPKKLLELESECFGPTHDGLLIGPIYNYWILKRKSRNNMPLLKAFFTTLMSNNITEKLGADDTKAALEGLKDAKKLRNEMEKVRLLLELLRKREKVKLLMIKAHEQEVLMRLHPRNSRLIKLLASLQALDKCDIFAQPVSIEQVPGYNKKINKPMDFSTMREKASNFEYSDFDDFERDFSLMISNCLKFNSKHTMYYKAAAKLRKQADPILNQARATMLDLSSEPMVDINQTQIIDGGDRSGECGEGDAVHKHEKNVPKFDDTKLNKLNDDDDDDDDEPLQEAICAEQVSIKMKDDSEIDVDNDNKNSNIILKPAVNAGDDDKDVTIITTSNNVDVRVIEDDEEDDNKEAEDTHEPSNVDATKLYHFNPHGSDDPNLTNMDDDDDYSDDLIIETISINDEEEIIKSSNQQFADEQTETLKPLQEIDCSLPVVGPPEVVKKQEILRFLTSLTRLVQSSHEDVLAQNITINMSALNKLHNKPQNNENSVTMTISKEMIEMMMNNSRPKSTRKTSSIYKRDNSNLNSMAHCFLKNYENTRTPQRLNIDPPRCNSTPFDEVQQTLRSNKNPSRSKFSKRSSTKRHYPSIEEADLTGTYSKEISDAADVVSPMKMTHPSSTSEIATIAAGENRRTSERTKTATHRYLIDDDNILAALMSPSKNRKRKNSTQDGTEDVCKSRAEDEPPVLSRCPSPIEEEEVRSTTPLILTFATKSAHSICSNFVDDDDDFAEPETYKHKTPSNSKHRTNKNIKIDHRKSFEPVKKKLKFISDVAPPLLVKTSVESPALRHSNSQRNCNSISRKKSRCQNKSYTAQNKNSPRFMNGINNIKPLIEQLFTIPDITRGVMPELEMNARDTYCHLETSLDQSTEMPRLDENVSFQDLSLANTEVVSFASMYDEDVLVAEECYPDVDDPGIILDKPSIASSVQAQSQKTNIFYGIIKSIPVYSAISSNKLFVGSENLTTSCNNASYSNKKSRKELETSSRMSKSSNDANISKMAVIETSNDELTAASALLDFTRFCGDGINAKTSADSRSKNIFDEINQLSNEPSIFPSTLSPSSSPIVPSRLKILQKPSAIISFPLLNRNETPSFQVPSSSNSSQVEYLSWSEKSEVLESLPRFAGNPDMDSAYSTSSSSSLISSSPNEERNVL